MASPPRMIKEEPYSNLIAAPPPTILAMTPDQRNVASQPITSYEAALTLPLKDACGLDLTDPHFPLLMKSLFLEKPPTCLQSLLRDLWKLLRFPRTLRFHFSSAMEEDLLHTCLMLVAIATGNRGSELAVFSREGLSIQQDGSLRLTVRHGFLYRSHATARSTTGPDSSTLQESILPSC